MKGSGVFYKVDPNMRTLLVPSSLIVASLILFIFSVNVGYSQVTTKISKLKEIETNEENLSTKLEILRQVQEGLLEYSNASLVTVPDKNPLAWTFSSLRKLIYQNSLQVNKAEVKARKGKDKLSDVTLSLELEGKLSDLIAFIESAVMTAPMIKVKSLDASKEQAFYIADVELTAFWADLPKKIPAIDEPITGLNQNELEVLADIKNLLRPEFNVLEPNPDSTRQTPFR